MKELKQLGFEFMPTLNEFRKTLEEQEESDNDFFSSIFLCAINRFGDLIDQPFKLGDFIPCIDGVPVDSFRGNKYKGNGRVAIGSSNDITKDFAIHLKKKAQAMEQVKFEGWELLKGCLTYKVSTDTYTLQIDEYDTIEQAINDGVKLKIKYK